MGHRNHDGWSSWKWHAAAPMNSYLAGMGIGKFMLRSYRADDWPDWFRAAGATPPAVRGPVFDSSWVMIEAAMQGAGVALAPYAMFERELREGVLVRPFATEVDTGAYWLTWLKSKEPTGAMLAFRQWILAEAGGAADG